MKNYTIRIKTAQFNEALTISYEAEKNQPVDLITKEGTYIGTYMNGRKMANVIVNNSIKIEVEL